MKNPLRYVDSSPEVIRLVVMMNVRYPLSLRNVEDLLFERGIWRAVLQGGNEGDRQRREAGGRPLGPTGRVAGSHDLKPAWVWAHYAYSETICRWTDSTDRSGGAIGTARRLEQRRRHSVATATTSPSNCRFAPTAAVGAKPDLRHSSKALGWSLASLWYRELKL